MFIAAIFIVAEYIKSFIFGGFPWLLVGYSQNDSIFNFIYRYKDFVKDVEEMEIGDIDEEEQENKEKRILKNLFI